MAFGHGTWMVALPPWKPPRPPVDLDTLLAYTPGLAQPSVLEELLVAAPHLDEDAAVNLLAEWWDATGERDARTGYFPFNASLRLLYASAKEAGQGPLTAEPA
jgi:hypothetical protein